MVSKYHKLYLFDRTLRGLLKKAAAVTAWQRQLWGQGGGGVVAEAEAEAADIRLG